MLKIKTLRETLGNTIFSVEFVKKDGTLRRMKARLGVSKGVTGEGLKFDPESRGLLPVYEIDKGQFRMININTIKRLKFKGQILEWK
jgi:hypothetical protein